MKNLNKNNFEKLTVSELNNLLMKEIKKPVILMNSELIENLTDVLYIKEGLEEIPTDEEISDMVQNIISNEGKIIRKKQRNACRIVASAAALLIGLNTYTVSAYNENIFSFAVKYTKDGVLVNFDKNAKEQILLTKSPEDPYGIIRKCQEAGLDVVTPYYLPDGFILTTLETDNNDHLNYLGFTYKNKEKLISLTFEEFHGDFPQQIGIPSNEHNISEIEICGHTAIMSREDNQMIVVCHYNNIFIDIFTQDVDYSECDKILQSYK